MRKSTVPIFMAFLIMGFGDVVGSLVAFAKQSFNLSSAMAGILPFVAFLAFGLLSVPMGLLQDKKGKKFVMLLGLGVALIGLVIPIISMSHYIILIVAICLLGAGMAVLQVAGNPMMRDVSEPGKYSRNLSFAQFVKSVGSLSGSLLIALVLSSWTGLFPIYAIAVAIAFMAVLYLKPTIDHRSEGSRATIKSCFGLLKYPYVALMVSTIFLYVGAEVGINSWIATYLNSSFGMNLESLATLGIGFFFAALMVGRLLGAIILNWIPAKIFFIITSLVSILGILGLFVGNQTVAIVSIFVMGLGFANIFPLVFSILIDKMPEHTNELSGLLIMAIVGGAIIPLFMGIIADFSVVGSFLVPLISFVFITFAAGLTLKEVKS